MGRSGARVVELEGHPPGGIFGRPATEPGRIQWTVEQEASRILASDSPFRRAADDGVSGVYLRSPACPRGFASPILQYRS